MTKIYTKTGDRGKTSLYGGQRVLKSNKRVETYGIVDELNSLIGIVLSHLENHEINEELTQIQSDLLSIGASLANPLSEPSESLTTRVSHFEEVIDAFTREIPELRNFILPGGGKAGAQLHLARSVVRRCERQIVLLSQEESVDQNIIIYFNRLSDLLFTLARFVNFTEKKQETIWKK